MTTRHIENRLADIEEKARAGLEQASIAATAAQAAQTALSEVITDIHSLREAIKEPA